MKESKLWGVRYAEPTESGLHVVPGARDRYWYDALVRPSRVEIGERDSAYAIWRRDEDDDSLFVQAVRGDVVLEGDLELVVVIRGLLLESMDRTVGPSTYLPYVNGCSTKQLFPPERIGDPTLQYMHMPPRSAEQAHHIHSTTRIVYIAGGHGKCVVGMDQATEATDLEPGTVIFLEPMVPHHFVTPGDEPLICVPVHVWSATPHEQAHPMFHGTGRI